MSIERRTEYVAIRMTPAERLQFEMAARRAGTTLSGLIRRAILGNRRFGRGSYKRSLKNANAAPQQVRRAPSDGDGQGHRESA